MSIDNIGSASGQSFQSNGSSFGNFNAGPTSDEAGAGSKLENDSAQFSSDLKGGNTDKAGKDAQNLLDDVDQSQGNAKNMDKAGTLEDIQKMLEQIMGDKGGKQSAAPQGGGGSQAPAGGGGAKPAGGDDADSKLKELLKMFIEALQQKGGADGANGAQGDQSQNGQNGQGGFGGGSFGGAQNFSPDNGSQSSAIS